MAHATSLMWLELHADARGWRAAHGVCARCADPRLLVALKGEGHETAFASVFTNITAKVLLANGGS
jgi:hypothetical protein